MVISFEMISCKTKKFLGIFVFGCSSFMHHTLDSVKILKQEFRAKIMIETWLKAYQL